MKTVLSEPRSFGLTAICICLALISGMMQGQATNAANAIDDIKGFHSDFVHHQDKSPAGQLVLKDDTIYFPWYGRDEVGAKCPSCSGAPSSNPKQEDIEMTGSRSRQQVGDLKAINSVKQRDIVYDEVQKGESDPQGLSNSMDVQIFGGAGGRDEEEDSSFEDNIENLVNSKLYSNLNGANSGNLGSARGGSLGNTMNIEVTGITVSAINTVEGGSAVANSNIVIKPVQIITVPAEVDVRLD